MFIDGESGHVKDPLLLLSIIMKLPIAGLRATVDAVSPGLTQLPYAATLTSSDE